MGGSEGAQRSPARTGLGAWAVQAPVMSRSHQGVASDWGTSRHQACWQRVKSTRQLHTMSVTHNKIMISNGSCAPLVAEACSLRLWRSSTALHRAGQPALCRELWRVILATALMRALAHEPQGTFLSWQRP
eukprot:359252-Chlamydomonas_euryale.AAC.8